MTDIHTHILPCIDDGAKDGTVSASILKSELAQGVKTVVFTPHYYGRKYSPEQFLKRRNDAFERLREAIPDGINTRLGAEVHFTGVNVPEYDELCKLAIEGTKYILIEFPFREKWTSALFDKLSEFIGETGYTPIIAHVERYAEILKRPAYVSELARMGCLIQVNAQAFLDKREKVFAFALLKHGMVHCFGTDAHDTDTRAPMYREAETAIKKVGFEKEWLKMQENMENILADKTVVADEAKPIKKIFGRYF